jgi:3'-5' exoribonuclease
MRQFIGSLAEGDSVDEVYLAAEKLLRTNRNGQPYIQIELRDRSGSITGRLWNAGETQFRTFEAGDYLRVRGKVQVFQNALQMILTGFTLVPESEVDVNDFLPHADADISGLLDRLRALLRSIREPNLKALGEAFLIDDDFVQRLAAAPAGVKNHHAYIGGLLEHVVTLMDAADRLAPLYPGVDRDLFLMGVFLHDVGKVRELGYEGSFSYTDEGQLVGHLVIGVEMLNEKSRKAAELTGEPFPRELLVRMQHVIVSHHGSYEFGSPKLPMTPEAVAIAALDNLDAKINLVVGELQADRSTSAWTAYSPTMQRRFFKGGIGLPDSSPPLT